MRSISIAISAGELLVCVGPNAAGKTTLLRTFAGSIAPLVGRVMLDDRDVHTIPPPKRSRRLALVPQRSSLAQAFRAWEYVAMALTARSGAAIGRGMGARRAMAEEALGLMALSQCADEPLDRLSAGQRQRSAVARAMLQLGWHSSSVGQVDGVLLADEPTSAMDLRQAEATMALLRDRCRRGGACMVMAHDLSLALRWADRLMVLDGAGQCAFLGPASDGGARAALGRALGVEIEVLRAEDGSVRAVAPALGRA